MNNHDNDKAPAAARPTYRPAAQAVGPTLKRSAAKTMPDFGAQKDLLKLVQEPRLSDLSRAWTGSEAWALLASSTRNRSKLELKRILRGLGDVPLRDLRRPEMREKILKWRASRFGGPRAADEGVRVLRSLVAFGRKHGHVSHDPTAGIKELWHGPSNAHIFWSEEEVAAFQEAASAKKMPQVGWAARLIAGTGLSLPEAISLRWSDVGDHTIKRPQREAGVREPKQRSLIRLPQLEPLLDELRAAPRQGQVPFVLVNRQGKQWVRATLYRQAKLIAERIGIHYIDPDTGEKSLKTFKDLQRTHAVRLMKLTSQSDATIASLFNWRAQDVLILRHHSH